MFLANAKQILQCTYYENLHLPDLPKTLKSQIFLADMRQLLQCTYYEHLHLPGLLNTLKLSSLARGNFDNVHTMKISISLAFWKHLKSHIFLASVKQLLQCTYYKNLHLPGLLKTLKSQIFLAGARQFLQHAYYENLQLPDLLKTLKCKIFLADARHLL